LELTEIPEHLLKRSRERRAALGLGGGGSDDAPGSSDAPAETVPATTAAAATPAPATPAPVEAPKPVPPKPDPPYIQAAKRRKRIPFWALPVLAALPLWGYVYVRTLEPPPAGADDPQVMGATVFAANCASCHGGTGGGIGNAPQLSDGKVLETFTDWRDQAAWVRLGTANWPSANYGDTEKPVGGSGGTMPSWTTLTDQQIAAVVLHERQISGADMSETNPDNADIYAVARGEKTLVDAGLGPVSTADGVTEADLGG
jgi:mono/diheme cytochrome c family protein